MQLDLVFDSLTTAVLVFDAKGTCIYVNQSSQSLLHRGDQWFLNRELEAVFDTQAEIAAYCRKVLEHGQQLAVREVEIPLPEWKQSLLVDLTISTIQPIDKAGLVIEMVDRKEFNQLSQDVDKSARFEAATRIIRGLCHEIKNPLGGIRGAAQLLEMEHLNSEMREYTHVITQEVDRLTQLLERMSSGAKQETPVLTDIHEPLTQIADLLKAEYGDKFELSFDFDSSLPLIEIRENHIKQALLNLIKNAIQWSLLHTEAGASGAPNSLAQVRLITRTAHPDVMRSLMPTRGIRIQIQDNGPGVDPAVESQLFLPMVTRREGGTGLGLAISQQIAQHHGGFIRLDEVIDQGASFSLYLPYQASEPQT